MAGEEIAVAVVQWQGRFLIGPRPEGKRLAGYWEFPGGRVEPGEPAEAAAVRECLEETGLCVEALAEYEPQQQEYPFGQVFLRFFACRPVLPALAPRPPFRWVPGTELRKYRFPEGNAALLKALGAE